MLFLWQAVAFTACSLFSLVPNTQVYCRLDAPILTWPAPPPAVRKVDPPPATELPVRPAAVS